MPISFNSIPAGIFTPGVHIEIDNSRANQGLALQPKKILVLGQKLAAGTAAAEVPIRVTSPAQAIGLFGRGSMLAHMFEALKAANDFTESWCLPLADNGSGVAATGDITFTGTATAAGTINLYLGGRRVKGACMVGETAAEIATATDAAIDAALDLAVTSDVDGSDDTQVNLAARHKGEGGNAIDVRVSYYEGEALPAGVTAAITAMSGGTGNPDVDDAIAAIGDEQYSLIVMPWTDATNLTALETELASRFGPMRMIEGHSFAAAKGTVGSLGTLGDARNSPHSTIMGVIGSPTPPWEWAASIAGVVAAEPDPARPLQTLALPGILPPREADRPTRAERNLLLHDGISTFDVDPGGVVRIERLITTYNQNTVGVDDFSYLDVETMLTLFALRYSLRARIALKFPRHKLADDGTLVGPGSAIATPKTVQAEIVALAGEWVEAGWMENLEQFKRDSFAERNQSDPNRVDALLVPDLVNQLRFFAGLIQFRL